MALHDSDRLTSLGEALPQEIDRVRALSVVYRSIGPAGHFAATLMEIDLQEAERAVRTADVVAMLRSVKTLRGWDD